VRLRPHFAAGWRELGRLLAERNEKEEAETCLRQAVELAPADEVARSLLRDFQRAVAGKK
jgi:Flp pilus assembly protein TadD